MKFFEKKEQSLANEIKRVITLRILLSFGILFIGILFLAIANVSSSFNQLKKNVSGQCAILSEFTISQSLIDNETAIELNLNNINAENRFIHFSWIKKTEAPPANQISWKFPFFWTEYCPIRSAEGDNFGYFKVSGSVLYNYNLFSEILMEIGFGISFCFVIFLLLYPLGNRIPERIFIKPIMELLSLLKTGWKEDKESQKNSNVNSDDEQDKMPVEILEIKSKLIQMLKEAEIHSHEVAFGQIAAKVAHDIRSPLAALNMLLKKNAAALPEMELNIIQNATQRINDIANNLLVQKREQHGIVSQEVKRGKTTPELAIELLENIVAEKKAQYVETEIQFQLRPEENIQDVFVNVNADELSRALSNLMNNAVEAIEQSGTVSLTLTKMSDQWLLFSVTDTGKGMLPEQLEKVLKNSVSIGKKNGSGIGLSSAIQSIESWGGTFSIKSELGKGTQVEFTLPVIPSPELYDKNPDFIFIDDSVYLTEAWKAQAKMNHKKIVVFNSVDETLHYIHYFPKETPLYVDSNLGADIKGEDLAKALYDKGFTTIYLCTGMDECEFTAMPWIKKIIGKEYPEGL